MEGTIARHVFAIPAVKAIGFGAGETFAQMRGSAANDPFTVVHGAVRTVSNHSGGVNAGVTNGMDVVFDVTFRPTPSIAKEQRTVDLYTMTETTISVPGRHDACIALRAAPAVESAAALGGVPAAAGHARRPGWSALPIGRDGRGDPGAV